MRTTHVRILLILAVLSFGFQFTLIAQLPDVLPDLVVSGLTWEPENPQVGDSVLFTAEITNIGDGATPAEKTHGVRFRVDGGTFGFNADHRSSLKPGEQFYALPDPESNTSGGYWIIGAPGTYEISIEIDDYCIASQGPDGPSFCTDNLDPRCENRICESDEDNNFYYQEFTIEGVFEYEKKPDLIVTGINSEPKNPVPGDEVVFSAVVKNQGDTVATSSTGYFGVNFMVDGTRVTRTAFDAMITELEPGESAVMTANWSLNEAGANGGAWLAATGTPCVTALVDKDEGVDESIEANNTFSKVYYIGAEDSLKRADLIVQGIYTDPLYPVPYQAVYLSTDVINQGAHYTEPAEEDHLIKTDFSISGISVSRTVGDQYLRDSILPGDTIRVFGNQVDHNLEQDGAWYSKNPGDYIITCQVDSWGNSDTGKIVEAIETNNAYMKRVTVMNQTLPEELPDLEILSVSWLPQEPEKGDSLSFSVEVKNVGTVPTPEDRQIKVRLTAFDTTLFASVKQSLVTGGTLNFDLGKARVPEEIGSNMVTVAVDSFPWFFILESTKSNNLAEVEISGLETARKEELTGSDFRIYPVPADGRFTVSYYSKAERETHIQIYSLQGQCLYKKILRVNTGQNELVIHPSGLTDGMYLVRMDQFTGKILLQRTP